MKATLNWGLKMTKIADYVSVEGVGLVEGDSLTTQCPECGREKFSITRTSTGLLYNCYRDACDTAGHAGAVGISQKREKHKTLKQGKLRPYVGGLRELRGHEYARFIVDNRCERDRIQNCGRFKWATDAGCYAFPVMDPRGFERGIVLRRFDGRLPKASTRMHTDGPHLSWYQGGEDRRVVLVEDQISAVRLQPWYTTVSLLGTSLTPEGAMEIANYKPTRVTIALDEDAVNTAYKLRKWYGLLFPAVDVVHLSKDVKHMTDEEIEEKFNATRA